MLRRGICGGGPIVAGMVMRAKIRPLKVDAYDVRAGASHRILDPLYGSLRHLHIMWRQGREKGRNAVLGIPGADFSHGVSAVAAGYLKTAMAVHVDESGEDQLAGSVDHLAVIGKTKADGADLAVLKDHVGGAAALLEKYEIGMIYQPDYSAKEEDSKPYLRYEETLQKEDLHPVTVKDNLTVIMEDVVFTIYPPEKLEYSRDKDNNRSLVTTVQHGDVRMFLAGDAERDRIDEILTQIPDLKSDLLKVPHHGHRERNSSELFQAVDPRYAVICADRDDKSDGPDDDIIEALEEGGAQVFTTGDGVVQAVSDGTNLSVRQ